MVRNPRRLLTDRVCDTMSLRDELSTRRIKTVTPSNPIKSPPKAAHNRGDVLPYQALSPHRKLRRSSKTIDTIGGSEFLRMYRLRIVQ
jgi:hypothetical protein